MMWLAIGPISASANEKMGCDVCVVWCTFNLYVTSKLHNIAEVLQKCDNCIDLCVISPQLVAAARTLLPWPSQVNKLSMDTGI
jgi:Fe-S-cluster-containing hydrogenase component 2